MTNRVTQRLVSFVTRRTVGLNRLNLLSRVASWALTAVLVFATLFGFEAARITSKASNSARLANALNDHFEAARSAFSAEESLERKYRLDPARDILLRHTASAAAFVAEMHAVSALGDARDRSVARDGLQAHMLYLQATKRMFAAVERHDTAVARALERRAVSPELVRIERDIQERAKTHTRVADAAFEQLSDTQQRVIAVTISLSALGLLSLGVFLSVLVTYQRRLKASYQSQFEKLEEAALIDNLTRIGNHRAYKDDFNRELSRAHRHGETLSVAVLDIDDFKVINDRHGHMHGDQVLMTLAKSLGSLRAEDRAYRVGGDEFAVLFPHTSTQEALETMQRLREDLRAQMVGTTVTIGLATLTDSECDVETLQSQADAAMFSGKRAGRNSVTVFDASMGDMWLLSPRKIHSLRELIAAGTMNVAFQPIWDVEGCRVLAYEALARPDAKYGFTGPQEAFDLAERIGRAHELDTVCREAALASAGDLPGDALLFINVSPQSLDHNRLDPAELLKAVRTAGLTPERVVIEITERSITQVDAVIEAARALQRHGFRLALDDTGAGNSGLEMLSRLTLEFVKIDREVIVKALEDKNARGVLAGIIAIAQTTDAYVIAEGIEDAEMLDFVCRRGVRGTTPKRPIDGVQGYLLRRPSGTFPTPDENEDIKALLKEFSVDGQGVLRT